MWTKGILALAILSLEQELANTLNYDDSIISTFATQKSTEAFLLIIMYLYINGVAL